ncbi:MAG: type VI secretion system tube protein Hcp [Pseudolabrys sp.]
MAEFKGDMFLKVEGAIGGVIKGESQDDKHPNEIDVLGWSWGMHVNSGMSAAGRSGRATLKELHVLKLVDSASTALMKALRNNEVIKKAVLSVRKAGRGQFDYLIVTMENARLTSLEIGTSGEELGPKISEKLTFAFHKISVDYVPQGEDGQPRGGMTFATETSPT